MKPVIYILAMAVLVPVVASCGNGQKVRRSPALVEDRAPARAARRGDERSFLEKAGDTTVTVVTAPVRLIAPEKKPVQKKQPERWEPAELIIVGPQQAEEEPTTQP